MTSYKFSTEGFQKAKKVSSIRPSAVVLLQVSVFILLLTVASAMSATMATTYAYGTPTVSEVAFKLIQIGL